MDDNDDLREALCECLAAAGYAVCEASDGPSALDLLDRIAVPDVLVVDLRMPGMDGLELLRSIRTRPRLASCARIVLTGDHLDGLDDIVILRKPVDAGMLLDVIQDCVSKRPFADK